MYVYIRVKLWRAHGMVIGVELCDNKPWTVKSWLFYVPGVASGSWWRMGKGCGTRNEWGVWSVGSAEKSAEQWTIGDKGLEKKRKKKKKHLLKLKTFDITMSTYIS